MSVGRGEPGLGLKRRHVSLPKTDTEPPPAPTWGLSDAVHQGVLFSGMPQSLCAKWTVHSEPNVGGWGPGRGAGLPETQTQSVLLQGSVKGPEGGAFSTSFLHLHQGPEQPHPPSPSSLQKAQGQPGLWVGRQAGRLSCIPLHAGKLSTP